MGCYWFLW